MGATLHACPTCALAVPAGFSYCPRCRAAAEERPYDPDEVDRHERQYVLSLVVLSLGAAAIPRLLRSRAFSPGAKVLVALLGLANTGAVFGIGYAFFWRWLPEQAARVRAGLGR
ncbi:MAG: hypothetical protein KF878_09370 [Planctomycetes bacterium]|nr:hypothetical protein [Planctomycetota bacterium]